MLRFVLPDVPKDVLMMFRALVLVLFASLPAASACRANTAAPATQPARGTAAPAGEAKAGKKPDVTAVRPKELVFRDINGIERKPLDCVPSQAKGAILFFLSHDCPISN